MTAVICAALVIAAYFIGVANGGRTISKAFYGYLEKRGLTNDFIVHLEGRE